MEQGSQTEMSIEEFLGLSIKDMKKQHENCLVHEMILFHDLFIIYK